MMKKLWTLLYKHIIIKRSFKRTLYYIIGLLSSLVTLFVFLTDKSSIFDFVSSSSCENKSTSVAKVYKPQNEGFYNFSSSNTDCAFFDEPDISAPNWICEHQRTGYKISSLGISSTDPKMSAVDRGNEAYINALANLIMSIHTNINNFSTQGKILISDSEHCTIAQIGNNFKIRIDSRMHSELEENRYSKKYKHLVQFEFKKGDCFLKFSNHLEYIVDGENAKHDRSSNLSDEDCAFSRVIEYLEEEGIIIKDSVLSPKNTLYVSMVATKEVTEKIIFE